MHCQSETVKAVQAVSPPGCRRRTKSQGHSCIGPGSAGVRSRDRWLSPPSLQVVHNGGTEGTSLPKTNSVPSPRRQLASNGRDTRGRKPKRSRSPNEEEVFTGINEKQRAAMQLPNHASPKGESAALMLAEPSKTQAINLILNKHQVTLPLLSTRHHRQPQSGHAASKH